MKARLTQCLVDQLIALEFSDDTLIDSDFAIKIFETTGAELMQLNKNELSELRKLLNDLSKSYDNPDHRDFVISLPKNFGLE